MCASLSIAVPSWGFAISAFLAVNPGFVALAGEKTTYSEQVLPLIEANCAKCHNPDKKKADLDLTSYQATLKGSGSGAVLASGNPDGSKLWKSLMHQEEPFMPPNRPKLPDKELEIFKQWILGGLLETATGKAVAAAGPIVDLALKTEAIGKPEGPPPMPRELPIEPVIHTSRGGAITGLACSPWAPLLAVAGQKQVLLFHSQLSVSNSQLPSLNPQLLAILPFTEGQPVDVRFSRNGKLLLASGGQGAKSGRVVVWDVTTGERLMTLGDDYDTILTADIRPDQSLVALGGPSRLVKLWSAQSGRLLHRIKKHTDWVTAVAFSPNGQMLATADRNGGISLWDPDNAQELFTLTGHKAAVTALSWRGDSKFLTSASEDGSVKLWEMQEGKEIKAWKAHAGGALCVNYAPDGRLVTCGRDNAVTLWNANGSKVRDLEASGDLPLRAVFSHDGINVFASDFAGHLTVWTAADGKRVGELNPNPPPLVEQIAAARKLLDAVQGQVDERMKQVAAAEAELAQATAAADSARKALEGAQAEQGAKATELAILRSALSTQYSNAPLALATNLSAATNAWKQALEKVTNTTITVEAKAKELEAARDKVAKAKADPALNSQLSTLNLLRAAVKQLEVAPVLSVAYHLRESLSAKKREQEKVVAALEAQRQLLRKAEQDLAVARETVKRAEAQIKAAKAEVSRSEPTANQMTVDLQVEQSRLEALRQQYRSALALSNTPAKP